MALYGICTSLFWILYLLSSALGLGAARMITPFYLQGTELILALILVTNKTSGDIATGNYCGRKLQLEIKFKMQLKDRHSQISVMGRWEIFHKYLPWACCIFLSLFLYIREYEVLSLDFQWITDEFPRAKAPSKRLTQNTSSSQPGKWFQWTL